MGSRSDSGNTELHDAVEDGNIARVKQLKQAGTNTIAKNEDGKTPGQLARDAAMAALVDAPPESEKDNNLAQLTNSVGGEGASLDDYLNPESGPYVALAKNPPKRESFPRSGYDPTKKPPYS